MTGGRTTGARASVLVLLLLVAGLGGLWLMKARIGGVDADLNAFLAPWREAPLRDVFLWLSVVGSAPAVSVAAVTATGLLGATRDHRSIVALWGAFAGAAATTWTIKLLVGRARPETLDAASALSPSFPSGHSSSALAVYGFLALVVARKYSRKNTRLAILSGTAATIALIGFSRLFLGLHYLSDVLAGFGVGGLWLAAAGWVSRTPRETSAS